MGKLRQFTVRPRSSDPCPHRCGQWARKIGEKDIADKDGSLHAPSCPVVNDGRAAMMAAFGVK